MAAQSERGVPLSTLSPRFLHSNSTSHTWPFGAIAELIDNAYDPDVNAKQFWIDKTVVNGHECLSFMDNGNGLDHETMHKMLSFGYSDKLAVNGVQPIGIYGNGFKSGSMRLGKDAIVFSKSKSVLCVGMLSQTYLKEINAEQIRVPIVCFEQGEENEFRVREEHKASLQDILRHSPFKTQEELLLEIDAITSSNTGKTGTRIIIWSLVRTSTGMLEFDFEKDHYDIQIPSYLYETLDDKPQQAKVSSHIPKSVYSLRAYCSILYLKPRLQINIRGQKVKSVLISKSLASIRKDSYKPTGTPTKPIRITFGYNTRSKDQYGIMMYHKNRLIKAYERIGCQLRADRKGVGVIGVIECNFLDPTHNKQSFNETDKYRRTMNSLATKLEEYCKEIRHKWSKENPNSLPVEDIMNRPDQNWVQCDDCSKWRKLPDGIDCKKLPDKWYCRLNPDPQFRSCQVEEEPVDSDDETRPSYRKTYKAQEREDKKNQERERQRAEEEKRRLEEQRVAQLALQNQVLKRTQEKLIWQLREKPAPPSPSTPTSLRRRLSSGLPVISNVRSLSPSPVRGKRTQPATPQTTPKRPKVNDFHLGTQDTSTSVSSPSVPVVDNNDDSDDVLILEIDSTPKPQKPAFGLSTVKTEEESVDVSMLMESSDYAAPDVSSDANVTGTESAAVGASRSPAASTENADTQTEVPTVKKEEEDTNQTEWVKSEHEEDFKSESMALPPILMEEERQDMMEAAAQERDALKEQVQELTGQLQDAQNRLLELSPINVRKECSHQASRTEETEGKDYKSLFEKAKQKIDELVQDKEALLATIETKPSDAQSEGKDLDEIALQVDSLLRELDQRNNERDELRLKLDSLEAERANLASKCEELRLSLQQQQREKAQKEITNVDSSAQTDPEEAGEAAAAAGTSSSSDTSSLIELRHNIGRLLVYHVPALDLDQVNFECNVIDEILEQVLSDTERITTLVRNRAINH